MFPANASSDSINSVFGNPEFSCKTRNQSTFPRNVQSPYLFHLLAGQFASWMQLTTIATGLISAFIMRVTPIIQSRANEKMIWTDALRHVAVMTNLHTLWDRSKMKFPRQTMSRNISVGFACPRWHRKYAILIAPWPFSSSNPFPAVICLADVFPKPSPPISSFLWHGLIAVLTAVFSRRIGGW